MKKGWCKSDDIVGRVFSKNCSVGNLLSSIHVRHTADDDSNSGCKGDYHSNLNENNK